MKKYIFSFLLLGFLLFLAGCENAEPQPTLNLPVKTDFSAYEQRDPNIPLYTRLSPEPLRELIPSEDYGTLYPFIGARQSYLNRRLTVDYYGFTDATGRIIVDPVYTNIELLSGGENGTRLPFWVLSKNTPEPNSRYSTCYAIASIDGSFVTGFDYSDVSGYPDCIVTRNMDPDYPVYEMYDHNMELLFTTADLSFSSRIRDARYYKNGLFLLRLADEEDRHLCYFMDTEGTLVAGPYESAFDFSCGWAAVKTSEGRWTYIDPTGKPMDRSFEDCDLWYQGGYTLVQTAEHTEVLDAEGNTFLSLPKYDRPSLTVTQQGLLLSRFDDQHSWIQQYYAFDGSLLYETQDSYWYTEAPVYLSDEDPTAPYLYHVGLNKKVQLPPLTEHTTIEPIHPGENAGPFLSLFYVDRRDRSMTFYLFTPELELVSVSDQTRPELFSEQPGKKAPAYVAIPGEEGAELYDPEGKVLGLCPMWDFDTGRVYEGGILSLTNDFCTKRFNSQGELIFCYPFTSTMED